MEVKNPNDNQPQPSRTVPVANPSIQSPESAQPPKEIVREQLLPHVRPLGINSWLVVSPGTEISRTDLLTVFSSLAEYSGGIDEACVYALDGAVSAAPYIDFPNHAANRDHHHGCDRLATPCSARQILDDINSGDFAALTDFHTRRRYMLVNDADLDAALAVWLVGHAELLSVASIRERIAALVGLEDSIDRRCGAFPLDHNDPLVKAMAWINEPYVLARKSAKFYDDASYMADTIEKVCQRITDYAYGRHSSARIETEYRVTPAGPGWAILQEDSYYARSVACLVEKYEAFASIRERADGTLSVTLFKRTPHNDFPIATIEAELVRIEAERRGHALQYSWGGAHGFFTASPRRSGTKLSREELIAVVNQVLLARAEGDGSMLH